MAFKQFVLDDGTAVSIYKRKSSRNLRITVNADGVIKVSIPRWVAYAVGLQFARSKLDWIKAQQRPGGQLTDGQAIGKAHRLRFEARPGSTRISSRLRAGEAVVYHPPNHDSASPPVQHVARRAATRALRRQAETLLPQRLDTLAKKHGFSYGTVTIKHMKSRWGSCDQHQNIVFNLYLMQLPWECIDYVILHELTHTKVLRHGPDFWKSMGEILPDVSRLRKTIRGYQPVVHDSARIMA